MSSHLLQETITPGWLEEQAGALPGAEFSYRVEWDAHILSVAGKQFARLGTDGDDRPILTLKGEALENEALRAQFAAVVPGYYSHKRLWNSVRLDAANSDASAPSASLVTEWLIASYQIVFASLTKRTQQELLGA